MNKFLQRSEEKELMDDLDCGGWMVAQTLKELRTINKLLGGNKVTTSGLKELMNSSKNDSFTLADLGCGGGDMAIHIKKWAIKNRIKLEILGVDANPNIIEFARERAKEENLAIDFVEANVFDPEFLKNPVDIQTCTLFTHHFTSEELVEILKNLKRQSKLGFVINDLHRHFIAYYSIKWLTQIFSKSRMVKNDAPVSVLRSFTKEDWEDILKASGIVHYKISWHWAFRWQVICWI
ncbi:methyltransferase domain-containing protein [Cyclobacterium marinum]|uniref:Methyltransferase type 11 n=1 Tax=Cyclobacterium marinum (strain ATCC 25205 / DSM 745 / LMG 13164 / NCIMB 1802) TaxID=880070 RepID=G0IVZ3_CYCMS|nr:methyltransferase domain-containing protein [Cyclobacterium marinum]AEL25538.1 Methyltransferase type 11 [Cyclobacterium marinum DSM 745]MBR9774149.1 methyltransferase domain-containing protein [Cytophagales bacterium]|tara:strand:- start:132625 stop:133332 length:708 start_codon:yes stop_codon:yes gene_type:complete